MTTVGLLVGAVLSIPSVIGLVWAWNDWWSQMFERKANERRRRIHEEYHHD